VRYVLMVFGRPGVWAHPMPVHTGPPDPGESSLLHELISSGELVDVTALADPINATTLSPDDGAGPAAAGDRYLAGFVVVDCESHARAVEIGRRLRLAGSAAVEIRPVMALSGLEM
jgi:hypothetical protein